MKVISNNFALNRSHTHMNALNISYAFYVVVNRNIHIVCMLKCIEPNIYFGNCLESQFQFELIMSCSNEGFFAYEHHFIHTQNYSIVLMFFASSVAMHTRLHVQYSLYRMEPRTDCLSPFLELFLFGGFRCSFQMPFNVANVNCKHPTQPPTKVGELT